MAKRAVDLLVAALGLVLLAPLFALVALAIKVDTPGPVLFRQERVGRHGVPFRMHKFRTMVADAPQRGLPLTVGADPRITRVGALLRGSRIDELPQLIDVLLGRMSLVGPRPEMARYVALYPPALRETLLAVRPGITDPASLAYRHEGELLAAASDPERLYVEELMPAKLQLSAAYLAQASFASDCKLLLRSLGVLMGRGGGGPGTPAPS